MARSCGRFFNTFFFVVEIVVVVGWIGVVSVANSDCTCRDPFDGLMD